MVVARSTLFFLRHSARATPLRYVRIELIAGLVMQRQQLATEFRPVTRRKSLLRSLWRGKMLSTLPLQRLISRFFLTAEDGQGSLLPILSDRTRPLRSHHLLCYCIPNLIPCIEIEGSVKVYSLAGSPVTGVCIENLF